jgi:predicted O-methyltransferase YrrM
MKEGTIDIVNQAKFIYNKDGGFIQMSPLALSLLDEFIRDRQTHLDRPFRLLEYGSGVSTAYFVSKYPEIEVYSVEGDKEWFKNVKTWVTPKKYKYHQATSFYTTKPDCNIDYITCMEEFGPFDLILNDGAQREMVADYIFANPEKFIAQGGMYLRHDYEMMVLGNWVGYHLPDMAQTGEEFVSNHPDYSMVTINGNGKWGYICELGGVWNRINYK